MWPVAEVSLVLLGQDVTTPCLIAPDGSALLGAVALGMGYLVALTGPRLAAIYPAAGMVVVLGFLFLGSVLWRHTAEA